MDPPDNHHENSPKRFWRPHGLHLTPIGQPHGVPTTVILRAAQSIFQPRNGYYSSDTDYTFNDSDNDDDDDMDSITGSSILSNRVIEDNYKLALKLFVNKNYEKSWAIITDLFSQSVSEFQRGLIGEKVLVKVISLYLVELGVNLTQEPHLVDDERANSLTSKALRNQLVDIFGTIATVPIELWYNYYLIFATNRVLYAGDGQFVEDIDQLYLAVPSSTSKYYGKFVDLYVYEILPSLDRFDHANAVIGSNAVYGEDISGAKAKLDMVRSDRQKQLDYEKQLHEERVRKQQEAQAEREALAKARSQKQLDYVKLTELSKSKDLAASSSDRRNSPSQSQVQVIMSRLRYVVGLTSAYIRQNGVILVAVLAVALISLRFINYRKLNLRERVSETIKMALKVTYM
jgi:hypothetical protein